MVPLNQTGRLKWLRGLVDLVLPPLCLGCGQYTEERYQICTLCLESIDIFPNPLCIKCFASLPGERRRRTCEGDYLPLYVFGNYSGALREIMIQFKFHGITKAAKFFAEKLTGQFGAKVRSVEAVELVPIPLHIKRENRRGYNQAAVLAEALGEQIDIPVRSDILYRKVSRPPQARIEFEKRAANVRGAFVAEACKGNSRRLLLVDDVVTSGATLAEARKVLNLAGYRVVGAISAAHGR